MGAKVTGPVVVARSHNPSTVTAIYLAFGTACLIAATLIPSAFFWLAHTTLLLAFGGLQLWVFTQARESLTADGWGHRLLRAGASLTLFALAWRILAESSFAERYFG
jgi:hypothetical protein